MDKIKVGEYARCGSIGIVKVCSIEEMPNLQDKGKFQIIDEQGRRIAFKYIRKHDKHILNLIEVGDYVNGCRVDVDWVKTELIINQYDEGWKSLKDIEIKTIVTHEQIERDTYYVQ